MWRIPRGRTAWTAARIKRGNSPPVPTHHLPYLRVDSAVAFGLARQQRIFISSNFSGEGSLCRMRWRLYLRAKSSLSAPKDVGVESMFRRPAWRTARGRGTRSHRASVSVYPVPASQLPSWLRRPKPPRVPKPLEIAPHDPSDALHRARDEEAYSWPPRNH